MRSIYFWRRAGIERTECCTMGNDADTYRTNNDDLLTGGQILGLWNNGSREFSWMGRAGGIDGDLLSRDIISGRWVTQDYEVRREPLPGNHNWFSIEVFVARVAGTEGRTQPARLAPKVEPVGWGSSRRNADAMVPGQQIYDGFTAGTLEYTYMGRTGGREGPELLEDLASGGWRARSYEVRFNRISGNRNWFSIESFVNGIDLRDSDPDAVPLASSSTQMRVICFLTKPRAQFDGGDVCIDCI